MRCKAGLMLTGRRRIGRQQVSGDLIKNKPDQTPRSMSCCPSVWRDPDTRGPSVSRSEGHAPRSERLAMEISRRSRVDTHCSPPDGPHLRVHRDIPHLGAVQRSPVQTHVPQPQWVAIPNVRKEEPSPDASSRAVAANRGSKRGAQGSTREMYGGLSHSFRRIRDHVQYRTVRGYGTVPVPVQYGMVLVPCYSEKPA